MEIRPFEPADYPAIVAVHNSLGIVWPERPRTPEAWAEADRHRSPKVHYQRLVAACDGAVVAFASYGQSIVDYHPQRFYVNVEVGPAHQRQGIGTALYDRLMAGVEPFDPRVFRADAFTNHPQGFRFLQARGFYEAWRETPVHLDIPSFDPSPYAGLEPRLLDGGIAVKPCASSSPTPGETPSSTTSTGTSPTMSPRKTRASSTSPSTSGPPGHWAIRLSYTMPTASPCVEIPTPA